MPAIMQRTDPPAVSIVGTGTSDAPIPGWASISA
jgi:hypothetical protein